MKNALELVKDLYANGEWIQAKDICNDYFTTKGAKSSYFPLERDEEEELALHRIYCTIQLFDLREFEVDFDSVGEDIRNNDDVSCASEKYNSLATILRYQVRFLGKYFLKDILNQTELDSKTLDYADKIALAMSESYSVMRDHYVSEITYEPYSGDDDSPQAIISLLGDGYSYLFALLINIFLVDLIHGGDIENHSVCSTDCFKKALNHFDSIKKKDLDVTRELLLHKGDEIQLKISELTDDFPYFDSIDGKKVMNMYCQRISLLIFATPTLPESEDDVDKKKKRIVCLKHAVAVRCDMINAIIVSNGEQYYMLPLKHRLNYYQEILKMESEIKEFDSNYSHPEISPDAIKENKNTGGCYVATAVYGSYDCPQVWTLRRYRDNVLAKTWQGRTFIKTYYAISPTLVKWFGHTKWFKNMWQGKLDRMVTKLQADGVESTPYEDKNW